MAATPTAAQALAAGALSPRGAAVAIAARRQAFRNGEAVQGRAVHGLLCRLLCRAVRFQGCGFVPTWCCDGWPGQGMEKERGA